MLVDEKKVIIKNNKKKIYNNNKVRLLCSEDTVAPSNDDTFEALKAKHPQAPSHRRPAAEFKGNMRFMPLQVLPDDVVRNLKSFPAGSSGGPDGLTAQHLSDLLAGALDE